MFEISVEDTFAGAHQLKGYEGSCENLHGHNWKVQVLISGEKLNNLGMLFDFKAARAVLKNILADFDHKYLNDNIIFNVENPTAENIAKIIFDRFKDKLPASIEIKKVAVWESETTCAIYHL